MANSSIKASRDEYNVRGKVPEVGILMRITREIVMRIVMRIMVRIMVKIMKTMIPDARISVTQVTMVTIRMEEIEKS